ncbi:hypothetical protein TSUD_326000 [Trifolium subterraneum]|uniref:DUF4283 domain-containing protein n=1 Tax=Trifolium subterraneum TaxID=3900 RepID=A0A2Z6LM58_TRISU|nr:hypothetical protein TSUD_326000 [Trifolium subterraneum]
MTMHEKSKDEEDLKERSTKKVKGGEQLFSGNSSLPKNYADAMDMLHERVEGRKSYKAMVVGLDDEKEVVADVDKDVIDEEIVDEAEIRVNEGLFGEYECPEFVFSKAEEKRIFMPWRKGVIVKLLGRRIGYKALKNRLKQMWVWK